MVHPQLSEDLKICSLDIVTIVGYSWIYLLYIVGYNYYILYWNINNQILYYYITLYSWI